jgi:hypothetical protein
MNLPAESETSPFVLRRARGEAPTEGPPPAPTPTKDADCPRCGGKLIDPSGLGWCRGCGYCHSLEEERAQRPAAPARASGSRVVELSRLLRKTPGWAGILMLGTVAVALFSLPPALALPDNSPSRCWWTTGQAVLGLLMILTAQAWAVMVLADKDDRLSTKDVFVSARLWALAVRYLPDTRRQLWLTVWGLTTVLSALFLIGGLDHWFTYLPRGTGRP